ncbi:MAG TPA: bifunctional 3-(3-hydroxy-phenyl)propionate/3-hydroxycinnamic acid hydroxylase [SAR324 cluster bacterium]|jgi:3-(3-hydroxy-phenyl)propionate hydroxylase|nr:3-(3-hydroxyphenyl)propionate hydroxylase [Deltaproteobacteria bacterium]MDP6090536.1 bifunctional 3-(3-hydroxy-phenyl)propionate/3-hydroxycinnamic acid hydroxylase [SAR324 cluster bacterium]MDP7333451.1 bifunctional 3-(3-hydroxy-phenyl)propionate/3-hydroxycinnamic acid hydroxylase [SAR324 cluster bacterium]MDP7502351.1 bifunctional 3-(3-hydroxy-phenyl)propionate/3-hydroxycinnamic acid hydroxylase [SAR324 cluster bacterium]HJO46409.1 bifunctional 3-(3-hydroxy-phenyl)propionate/3-hydroxycinna|tara:strand:- start:9087 stop:10586 length:1500 start_codon:yes stop_codon:yes gene_type:complete
MMIHKANSSLYDCIIIGYGPTGATLANLLGLCGLKVMVLEREAQAYHLPRAVHFDDETMRVFQTVGIAEELSKKIRVNIGMRFVDPEGTLLLDWPRPQEIGPHGWYASYRFHQPDLEHILRKALGRYENVETRSNSEVFSVKDQDDNAIVYFKDLTTGKKDSVNTKYVVGCDGARSFLRYCMETEMENLGFNERWLVIDALLKKPMPELGDHTVQFCNPKRPTTYCRSPGDRRRWEIKLQDHEDENEITNLENVWELLKTWITSNDAEIERKAVYTFSSSIAKKWKLGRLLLAGDAAHLTPPFMGQGMCAGIRDVANLAWKIALCSKDAKDDSLLHSYQSERSPHVKAYIETAIHLGGLINRADNTKALKAALPNQDGSARMKSIAPKIGESLKAGSSEHRGKLFPQLRLSDSRLMDDASGYSPVLLIKEDINSYNLNLPTGLIVISSESEKEVTACLQNMGTDAVLIRPDRYILGTAKTKEELNDLLSFPMPSPLHRK